MFSLQRHKIPVCAIPCLHYSKFQKESIFKNLNVRRENVDETVSKKGCPVSLPNSEDKTPNRCPMRSTNSEDNISIVETAQVDTGPKGNSSSVETAQVDETAKVDSSPKSNISGVEIAQVDVCPKANTEDNISSVETAQVDVSSKVLLNGSLGFNNSDKSVPMDVDNLEANNTSLVSVDENSSLQLESSKEDFGNVSKPSDSSTEETLESSKPKGTGNDVKVESVSPSSSIKSTESVLSKRTVVEDSSQIVEKDITDGGLIIDNIIDKNTAPTLKNSDSMVVSHPLAKALNIHPRSEMIDATKVHNPHITVSLEDAKLRTLTQEELVEYCEKLFNFETVTFFVQRKRKDFSKAKRERNELPKQMLPTGTKLWSLTRIDSTEEAMDLRKKKWMLNPKGRSCICMLHEYVQFVLRGVLFVLFLININFNIHFF